MSARRALTGSAVALLMPASLLMTTQAATASANTSVNERSSVTDTSARRVRGQRISAQALPQIVQQGKRVASADSAKAAITATIKPVKTGRPVTLEVLRGTTWAKAGKTKLTSKGQADFAAAISASDGTALTYRVVASKFKGLASVTSDEVSTERWLTPTWTDEFAGRVLGPEWSHRAQGYSAKSKRACSKTDPAAVKVGRGAVRLSVLKDKSKGKKLCKAKSNGKNFGKVAYRLNGHIGTEGQVTLKYGFAAARVKFHKLRGQHGSFWMQPDARFSTGKTPSTNGAEIDVIEYFGAPHPNDGLTSFIHHYVGKRSYKTGSWIKNSKSFLANRRDSWSKSYHVFSVEWTPKSYIFRIDGKETWRTNKGVSGTEQYPILSLLSSDYELGGIKDKQLPQHMYVDWVRMWQA